jgi:7-cyano-7-deazaguanine reductase
MSTNNVLGKVTEYPTVYDPGILVKEHRQQNRDSVGLKPGYLPFEGYDVWNAYEVSALTTRGVPVVGVCKIVYPCDNLYIVESKSLKLYFNSYNMHTCGDDPREVRRYISDTATEDLSKLLQTDVKVVMFPSYSPVSTKPVRIHTSDPENTEFYLTLEDLFVPDEARVYKEDPSLLALAPEEGLDVRRYHSALLKSNCKVTSQPDWGDVYVSMEGTKFPTPSSLLQYIISFRDECHFHEEICETIYQRLWTTFSPAGLEVTCLYARRGGIDINPTRYSDLNWCPYDLASVQILHSKTLKQ